MLTNINGQTDWVVTMPTKREYTQGAAIAPFVSAWNPATGRACEEVTLTTFDREEAFNPEPPIPGQGGGFSPAPPAPPGPPPVPGFNLCTEVSVITFGEESAVDASDSIRYGVNGSLDYTEGWAILDFFGGPDTLPPAAPARRLEDEQGVATFIGLPALGFAVFEYTNGTLDGGSALANYEAAVDHKTVTIIETP